MKRLVRRASVSHPHLHRGRASDLGRQRESCLTCCSDSMLGAGGRRCNTSRWNEAAAAVIVAGMLDRLRKLAGQVTSPVTGALGGASDKSDDADAEAEGMIEETDAPESAGTPEPESVEAEKPEQPAEDPAAPEGEAEDAPGSDPEPEPEAAAAAGPAAVAAATAVPHAHSESPTEQPAHVASDVDAMGLDKRRSVVGGKPPTFPPPASSAPSPRSWRSSTSPVGFFFLAQELDKAPEVEPRRGAVVAAERPAAPRPPASVAGRPQPRTDSTASSIAAVQTPASPGPRSPPPRRESSSARPLPARSSAPPWSSSGERRSPRPRRRIP